MRVILHVDMDGFFAAVEVRESPDLKGVPVIIGGRIQPSEEEATVEEGEKHFRGVVSTCSYEARTFGVHSAMPLSHAYKLCPNAVFLPVNMALYKQASARIMGILRKYAAKFEQVSIDEAYLEISTQDWKEARAYAEAIKKEIVEQEGLTCSVGVAPNKIIAKIASDFVKPDGLTVVEEEHAQAFLAPLPVNKIPGVGPKTEKLLNQMGIKTIEQLASFDVQKLIALVGKHGWRLHQVAQGIDESEVEEKGERKSLSRETTLEEHTDDLATINRYIEALAESVHGQLLREGFAFKTVGIKVKFDDFTVHTRAKTFRSIHSDLLTVTKTAKQLMQASLREMVEEKQVRLVGVRVSTLGVVDAKQRRLM
jgi:DNA polymerase IV (DinB-like DNA polymerase)